nr:MAG TPA: hypothetical protein [Podoviridae sp. ctY3D12]
MNVPLIVAVIYSVISLLTGSITALFKFIIPLLI